jgi:hypothetical protein
VVLNSIPMVALVQQINAPSLEIDMHILELFACQPTLNQRDLAYVLTPAGTAACAQLTAKSLQVKLQEYKQLSAKIARTMLQTQGLDGERNDQ